MTVKSRFDCICCGQPSAYRVTERSRGVTTITYYCRDCLTFVTNWQRNHRHAQVFIEPLALEVHFTCAHCTREASDVILSLPQGRHGPMHAAYLCSHHTFFVSRHLGVWNYPFLSNIVPLEETL